MRMHMALAGLLLVIGAVVMSPAAGDASGRCRDRCPPPPPIHVVLKVCHPCTHCEYEVMVCIPACCTDVPCVSHHRTLIGAGKTVYEWKSGHQVVIRFPNGGGYRVIQRG
ncbi:MAG: hypothetical protein L0Y71_21975 [Gemmataceae bacterium]|nr:hypothetical protein [Gemmataceae bacterium]